MDPLELIRRERLHQAEQGWTSADEDAYLSQELAYAAACFAAPEPVFILGRNGSEGFVDAWPPEWPDKRNRYDRMRQLQIAGSLIVAEMERLQRQMEPVSGWPEDRF